MRPTINSKFQTCSMSANCFVTTGVTIIVALFLPLFNTLFTVLTFLVFYITVQNFTKYTSQVSVKLFQISKAEWTPVLFYKIWYYRMPQKPSQVVPEQILTLYFKCPSFSSNHLFNVAPNVQGCFFCPVHSQSEAGGLWPLYLKTRQDPRGFI